MVSWHLLDFSASGIVMQNLVFSGNYRELVDYLNESTELLSKNTTILDNVLETLDLQQHSLGVLYVLVVKFNDSNVSRGFSSSLVPD
jgi:COP9 signalosome complex subunit 3